MSAAEPARRFLADPPKRAKGSAEWTGWAVVFLNDLSGTWSTWQATWTRRELPVVQPGNPDAFLSLEREARQTGWKQEFVLGGPPQGLARVAPLLDGLSEAVLRFAGRPGWRFESTQEAEHVARDVLALAQDFEHERYLRVDGAKLDELSRTVTMAAWRGASDKSSRRRDGSPVKARKRPLRASSAGRRTMTPKRTRRHATRVATDAPGETPPETRSAERSDAVNVPASTSLTPFNGGELVFFSDRVELRGVDICGGARSGRVRKILDVLRERATTEKGRTIGGGYLATRIGVPGGQNAVAAAIRGFRQSVVRRLREERRIRCDRGSVVVNDRRHGYRFANWIAIRADENPK